MNILATGLIEIEYFALDKEEIAVTQEIYEELDMEGFVDDGYWIGTQSELLAFMIGVDPA